MRILTIGSKSDTCWGKTLRSLPSRIMFCRIWTELSERLRLRRGRGDTSEDDEGLPHSPCNSPTTTEGLLEKTAIKDLPTKSHSTCSDGSLLSMGSSEMDEESFSQASRHSSKLSLYEKKVSEQDSDLELGSSAAPLNHSAAHHRVAVRPKRRAPGKKRVPQLSTALPATPEVNEESSIRSVSPENITKDTIVELHSMNKRTFMTDTQLKCSSLPPGLVAADMESNKLNRSRSNAGSKSQDHFAALEEELIEKEEKTTDKSFFDRIFPRRSAKKKKSKEEKIQTKGEEIISREILSSSSNQRLESKPIAAPRTGAAARQRIQPIDLPSPSSPDSCRRRDFETIFSKPSPEKSLLHSGTSPLQAELETLFKQRQNMSCSNELSPTCTIKTSESNTTEINKKDLMSTRQEEIRMKIPGLSSLQQRVLLHHQNDFDDDIDDSGFKSLNEFTENKIITKPITKSHSFKSTKVTNCEKSTNKRFRENSNDEKIHVGKAASLDSVKHLDESKTVEISENLIEIKNEKFMEMMKREEYKKIDETMIDKHFNFNDVTISGPSHTAIVNVSNNLVDNFQENSIKKELSNFQDVVIKENTKETTTKESVSITKIQLKRESNQMKQSTVTVPKPLVPEFLNRQLNKVEQRSSSNVVFSTTSSSSPSSSPRIIEEQIKPKAVFTSNTTISETTMNQRKFSQEDIEIVEKTIDEDQQQQQQQQTTLSVRYKKNENLAKTRKPSADSLTSTESPKCEKSILRSRSVSLDSLKGEMDNSDKSSQDSLDKLDEKTERIKTKEKISTITESVVLRKKSLVKQKTDDEPELMKVFARRSLKLKDNECDAISQQINSLSDNNGGDIKTTRDSDKENQTDSPKEERKKSMTKLEFETKTNREPLTESKTTPTTESIKSPTKKESLIEQKFTETSEVVLRKPINNIFNYQRTISLNPVVKNSDLDDKKLKKHTSFNNNNNDRRRIESWSTTNIKNNDLLLDNKISQDVMILTKSDIINDEFITETKNFNQRKAEWEKRAQEAQKKSVP